MHTFFLDVLNSFLEVERELLHDKVGVELITQYVKTWNDFTKFVKLVCINVFDFLERYYIKNQKKLLIGEHCLDLLKEVVYASCSDSLRSSVFNQISKVIKLRDQLKLERVGFTAEIGGFDTHGTFDSQTKVGFEKINKVLQTFKEEMEAQNAWENVAVVLTSDFGRTITSNGKGTDHGKYIIISVCKFVINLFLRGFHDAES